MKKDNIVQIKSYRFAVKIVLVCRAIQEDKNEYVLSKQLLRCGTSIGANIEEAIGGQSKRNFLPSLPFLIKKPVNPTTWYD